MTEPRVIAEVRDLPELQRAFRQRAFELGIPREELDSLACIPDGYASKLLADPPVRQLGYISLWGLMNALKLQMQLIENPNPRVFGKPRPRKIKDHDPKLRWQNAKALGMMREEAKSTGKMGATARMEKTTPQQRSRSARKAARARWKLYRTAKATKPYLGTAGIPAAAPPAPEQAIRRPRSVAPGAG